MRVALGWSSRYDWAQETLLLTENYIALNLKYDKENSQRSKYG